MSTDKPYPPAPLWRQFAALIYDIFIVFSFILLATAMALVCNQGRSFLPIQSYFLIYLFTVTSFFITWFWQKSGQTLGMLSWKIKLVDLHYQPLTWRLTLKRYFYALCTMGVFGFGLFWRLIDKEKQSLHDRLAGTKVIFTS